MPHPDFTKIIFALFKKEQGHSHKIDNKDIDVAIRSDKRAQYMTFTICIIVLDILCISGKKIADVINLIMNLCGLIAAFLKSNKNKVKKIINYCL